MPTALDIMIWVFASGAATDFSLLRTVFARFCLITVWWLLLQEYADNVRLDSDCKMEPASDLYKTVRVTKAIIARHATLISI